MKKILISLAGTLMMALVVVLFINAKGTPDEAKTKAKAETAKVATKAPAMTGCGACPEMAAASCAAAEKKAEATKTCTNPECKDPNCKGECKTAAGTAKACDPAACPGMKATASQK